MRTHQNSRSYFIQYGLTNNIYGINNFVIGRINTALSQFVESVLKRPSAQ